MGALANGGAAAWVAAVLLWPVVAMLPGYVVTTALTTRLATLERWAVAPLVSIAIAFLPGIWCDWLRPGSGLLAAVAALVLASLSAAVVLRRRGIPVVSRPAAWSRQLTALLAVMAAACTVAAAAVLRSTGGLATVVPNDDGNGHGSFVTQILLTGSLDPTTVTAVDPTAAVPDGAFYPLGMHVLAAIVAALSSVPAALVVVGLLAGAVWAPLAAFALARRFLDPTAAVVAAGVLALATPWFPWAQMAWGGWPFIIALALVPAAVIVVLELRSISDLPIAVLALAGLFAVHVTELVVVGIIVGFVLVLDPVARASLPHRVGWLLAAPIATVVVAAPFARGFLHAQGVGLVNATSDTASDAVRDLVQRPYYGFQDPSAAWGLVLTVWSVTSLALLLAGSVLLWRRTAARGVVASTWLFLALAYCAYAGWLGVLTTPWYGSGNRLLAQAGTLAVIPLSAAALAVGRAVRLRWPTRTGTGVVAALGALVCLMLVTRSVQAADVSFARAMVTSDHLAAFAWLRAHDATGDRVLNDPRDGSVWAFATSGGAVAPVFGPKHPWASDPTWAGRVYLQSHVADAASDPRVRAEAATWKVRYVLVGPAIVTGGTPMLDTAAIAASPGLHEVFRSGDVRIYELAIS